MTTPTMPILTALDKLAAEVAREHGITGRISIVLGASGVTRSGQKHGHFAAKSWEDDSGEDVHEILMSSESLKRGPVETLGTHIHELAHAYCHEQQVVEGSGASLTTRHSPASTTSSSGWASCRFTATPGLSSNSTFGCPTSAESASATSSTRPPTACDT